MAKAFNPAYPALRDGAVAIVHSYGDAWYIDTVYSDRVEQFNVLDGVRELTMEPFTSAARAAVGPYHN